MPAMTSRFSVAAKRTRTITGGTSVGGSSSTVVSIHNDGTIRFTDRFGVLNVVPIKGSYRGDGVPVDRKADPLWLLVDALIARA